MSGSGLLHTISFIAVVIVVLLTVWIVLVLESGGHRPARRQEEAKLSDEPGQTTAQPRALRSPSLPSRTRARPGFLTGATTGPIRDRGK